MWVGRPGQKGVAGPQRWIRASLDDGVAAIKMVDAGSGREPGRAEALVEPFRQVSEGMTRNYEGTELTVTKKATRQMGGSIKIETEKGGFTAWVPGG